MRVLASNLFVYENKISQTREMLANKLRSLSVGRQTSTAWLTRTYNKCCSHLVTTLHAFLAFSAKEKTRPPKSRKPTLLPAQTLIFQSTGSLNNPFSLQMFVPHSKFNHFSPILSFAKLSKRCLFQSHKNKLAYKSVNETVHYIIDHLK